MSKIAVVSMFHEQDVFAKKVFTRAFDEITVLLGTFNPIRNVEYKPVIETVFIDVKPYQKNISVGRLRSCARFAEDAYKKLKEIKPDFIYAVVPPNSLVKTLTRYKRENPDCILVFSLIDMWPEALPVSSTLKRVAKPFLTWWASLRDKNLHCADGLVLECNLFREVLAKHKAVLPKTHTLYLSLPEAADLEPALPKDTLNICYLGSINNIIDIDKITELLHRTNLLKPVSVKVIGDGENRDYFIEKLKAKDIDVVYHGRIFDEAKKAEIFKTCHFGLNVMKEDITVGLTMKSLDYFQSGLPIINTIKGDTFELVERYRAGINLSDLDKAAMTLSSLTEEEFLKMRLDVKKMFLENFEETKVQQAFLDFVAEIRSESSKPKKRALITASVGEFIASFELNNIRILQSLGYEVQVGANFDNCNNQYLYEGTGAILHQIDYRRVPWARANLTALKQIRELFKEYGFSVVHCHTPTAGILVRHAAKRYLDKGLTMLYTAHGFHFFKGAPLRNWLVYYPLEKHFSKSTDILITINEEDRKIAEKKLKAKKVCYIPGVGVDIEKYARRDVAKAEKRNEIGVPENCVMIISVGELNANKNHQIVIRAVAEMKDTNIHYCIAGRGELYGRLIDLAERLGVREQVHLLGIRRDIPELLNAADIFISPSIREGRGMTVTEAMCASLPIIVSKNRGHLAQIDDGLGGVLVDNDVKSYVKAIRGLLEDGGKALSFAEYNKEKLNEMSIENVGKIMEDIYLGIGGEK